MKILVKNGTIINDNNTIEANVFIEDGKIISIEKEPFPDDTLVDKTIDARGCYLFPGGIDPHVHMQLPSHAGFSSDDFLTGSKAALEGGTTTIIDFVTPKKGQLLSDAILQRKRESAKSIINCLLHVSPVEWRSTMTDEIKSCVEDGYSSFKVYMAYKNSIGLNDDVLLKVMMAVGEAGGKVMVHCEMGDDIEDLRNKFAQEDKLSPEYHPLSRPPHLEALAVKTALEIAKKADCPIYIVHVSAKESLICIKEAQANGQDVVAETCPQYLLLDDSKYIGDFDKTAPFVMSPPLRKPEDNNALWEAITDGTVQTIGTDHCPFNLKQKEFGIHDFRKIPNGAGGVEHRLSLLYTYGVLEGKITLNQFVALTSANAAKVFGLYPAKGVIAVGSDADIVIWDPSVNSIISKNNHIQNCDTNIYDGIKTKGKPRYVLMNDKIFEF